MLRFREKENFLLSWYGMGIESRNHEESNYHPCLSQIKETG